MRVDISDVSNSKTKFLRPRPRPLLTRLKTKTTGIKQRHLANLTFKYINVTVDLHSSDVPRPEQRNYKWYMKSCCVLQDHYDDERDKTVFHNTTSDLQDQDHSVQDQDQDRFFGLRSVLSQDRRSHTTSLVDICITLRVNFWKISRLIAVTMKYGVDTGLPGHGYDEGRYQKEKERMINGHRLNLHTTNSLLQTRALSQCSRVDVRQDTVRWNDRRR